MGVGTLRGAVLLLCWVAILPAQREPLIRNARKYFTDLVRINTSNPPGRETAVAEYIRSTLAAEGFQVELLGADRTRLNAVTRLAGSGKAQPLLLMAHSDVVPADQKQWSLEPFEAQVRNGVLYGRGAQDAKNLLAAEMAVLVELKRTRSPLSRDVILLSESDEEAGSTGIQWLIANAWRKIQAEYAINEGGNAFRTAAGVPVFQIQTTEKVPTRIILTARGTAGHGSLPRPDNPVVHLARALVRLADADQPPHLSTTTRRYLNEISRLDSYQWLAGIVERLDNPATAEATANRVFARDPELGAMLRTTISPTMLEAGLKINVIPNIATAGVDARRLPSESREEVLDRFRRIINDNFVDVSPAGGQEMPSTEPSSLSSPLYLAMEKLFLASDARAVVVPYMSRGATDGAFLREKGIAVYGAPIFFRGEQGNRAHGNDESLDLDAFDAGVRMLWQLVRRVAAE